MRIDSVTSSKAEQPTEASDVAAPLRIAFLTPEFVTDQAKEGGLGNYLNRITKALRDLGHAVEIFLLSDHRAESFDFEGVLVHRVTPPNRLPGAELLLRGFRFTGQRGANAKKTLVMIGGALALARALAKRERTAPFHFVQSADFLVPGLFVRRRPDRPHVVRCSCIYYPIADANNRETFFSRAHLKLQRRLLLRADRRYAPSQFVADRLDELFQIKADVLRPPAFVEATPTPLGLELPPRYFVHFGRLRLSKGSDLLANSLLRVWTREPAFAMVWAGYGRPSDIERWQSMWGANRTRVTIIPSLAKPQLYDVLSRAEAAVLPSLVDNLPNTVIESLMLGLPVIGSNGASIDELVETERNGLLTPVGDADALADAMVRVWRGDVPWHRDAMPRSAILDQMWPAVAAENLTRLARPDLAPSAKPIKGTA